MQVVLAKAASSLFEYPDASYLSRLASFESRCGRVVPLAARPLRELYTTLSELTLDGLQELYTRTFDLTPACAPYLSVHLFGESSFKRARLMTGLAELYADRGVEASRELPDHLAVVLAALEFLEPKDQSDLLTHCLGGCLEKMLNDLLRQQNPYSHAIRALEELTKHWCAESEVNRD